MDRTRGQGGGWTQTRGLAAGPEDPPPAPAMAARPGRDLPVVPERRAWPVNCPYTEAAWGKALKGGTEAPAGTPGPEPTCCRSKKAELDKEEGVELELDTSGVSCFMAKGE